MDANCINQIPSEALWAVASFVFGVLIKYLFNIIVTPKIEISDEIVLDTKTKEPYIKVINKSCAQWNKAYGLHFYLTYYHKKDNNYEPFHTGLIDDGILKPDSKEKYAIKPKEEIKLDFDKDDYKVGVVLIYRNRYSTYSIVERECSPNTGSVKSAVKR